MLKSGTYESTISRAYPFVASLVEKLRSFTSLDKKDIVLQLAAPLDLNNLSIKHFDAILPFYELETFTNWKLKWTAPGIFPPQPIPNFLFKRLTARYQQ